MIFLRRLCLFLIRIYQMAISPHFPPCCRYVPSCSVYAYQAVEKYGVFRGGFLALKRLLRCHPFHEGGYDPLPDLPKNRAATVSSAREKTFTLKNFIVCEGFNTPRQIPYQNNISRCLRRGC